MNLITRRKFTQFAALAPWRGPPAPAPTSASSAAAATN
jgi:hypothetical protein